MISSVYQVQIRLEEAVVQLINPIIALIGEQVYWCGGSILGQQIISPETP